MFRLAVISLLLAGLLAGFFYVSPSSDVRAQEPQELIEKRTRTSKTFSLGGDKYALDVSIGSIHYKNNQDDPAELWKDIDPNIQPSSKADWDWEVVRGNWHLLVRDDTSVAVGKDGNWIGFRYEGFAYYDTSTGLYQILDTRRGVTPTIEGNKIRWEGLFYGVNLEYTYTPDRFKEDLEVTQVARDWLADNPPSSFGLSNQTSYLVGYLECDWRDAYPAEDEQGELISFDNLEFEGESIFWRHPIKDYLVTTLPIGWARHSDLTPEDWLPIRQRFYKAENGKHYLLFGSKVSLLNQMPSGTIVIDPTVDEQVGANNDDCYRKLDTSYWSLSYGYEIAGAYATGYQEGSGLRFQTVNIPKDAICSVAYLTFTARLAGDGANCLTRITGEAVDSAVEFANDSAAFDTRYANHTTAVVDWDNIAAWSVNEEGADTTSPSITSILDEIFARAGWAANNDLVLFWQDFDDRSTHAANNDRYAWSYEGDSAKAPKLHIEYSAGGVVAPTVVTNAASSVEETTATLSGNITATGGANCTDRGFEWDVNSGAPYADNWTENGNFGVSNFTHGVTSLPTGTTIYYRAIALNSAGWGYGSEVTFLTKPAAPTNVAATDGSSTANVTITWTKSTGATDYHVWRDAVDLGAAGDVATFDDVGATAGTITNAGTVTASDGSQTAHIVLSLAGEATGTTSHTYKVIASNATGDSGDSATDTGYRGVGAITYQWQRSAADSDAAYGNIGGATTDPYNDTAAPAGSISHSGNVTASDGTSSSYVTLSLANEATTDGAGRYYQCIVSATGASNSPQTSNNNRGYRTVGAITFQWQRSAADSDAAYGNIAGGTTDPYNDTGAPAHPAARYFQCVVSSVDASNTPQTSDSDRGYRAAPPPPPPLPTDPRDPDLVYLELRPDLDEVGVVEKGFVPSIVYPGIFFGYSLPIWVSPSSNETLYFMICVPGRWDESSDIFVHVKTATSDNQTGNVYELELGWDKVTPNVVEAIPTGAPNVVTVTRAVGSELTYACYQDWFTVDYDIDSGDPVEANDTLAFRFRRFGGSDNLTSELIVFEFAIYFARGDLLGEEEGMTESIILMALIFLALGLTIAMFATREMMLGFPALIMWMILGGFAYTESTTAWGDWQFYLFFASAFGMTIFCAIAMYGLRERRDAIADEELEKGEEERIGVGEGEFGDEAGDAKPSKKPQTRRQALHERANNRRNRL